MALPNFENPPTTTTILDQNNNNININSKNGHDEYDDKNSQENGKIDQSSQDKQDNKFSERSNSRSRSRSKTNSQSSTTKKKPKSHKKTKSGSRSRSRSKKSLSKSNDKKKHSSSRSPALRQKSSPQRSSSRKHHHRSHRRKSTSRSPHRHSRHHKSYSRSPHRSHFRRQNSYNDNNSYSYNDNYYQQRGGGRFSREKRENPPVGRVLGCFGLSQRTTENELRDVFERYGVVEKVTLIIDRKTGVSKGFGFIYFDSVESATKAKNACAGMELDGRIIRVDYSLTRRPHSPTPGTYLGRRGGHDNDTDDHNNEHNNAKDNHQSQANSRSRSRSHSNSRSHSRDH